MMIRVLTWNLFHGRDGHPAARATWRSTLCRRPVEGGDHLHVNRRLVEQMADVIARRAPDVAALQEVPAAAVCELAARTGMAAAWVTTGPLAGPGAARDRWAAANPDLWRTHEGNANVVLVGPRLQVVRNSLRRVRLNPAGTMLRLAARGHVPPGQAAAWVGEQRALVALRIAAGDGREFAVGCLHLHNSHVADVQLAEALAADRAMTALAGADAALLAGDVNVHPGHVALAALSRAGWQDAGPDRGIDRVLHRGLEPMDAPRALADRERTVLTPHRGRWWPVLLSDHAPVEACYRLPGGR